MSDTNTNHTDKPVRVMLCACKHPYQDKAHGENQRVHNPCKTKGGRLGYRCTVCGNVKEL